MTFQRVHVDHPDLQRLVCALDRYFAENFGAAAQNYQKYHDLSRMRCAVVAYRGDVPVGCGCWRPCEEGAEVKRMYVEPFCRRGGVAAGIIAALEADAYRAGYRRMVLETGAAMPAALAFYETQGYVRIPNYGDFVDDPVCICMEKHLDGVTA